MEKIYHLSEVDLMVLEQYKVEAAKLGLTLTEYLLFTISRELEQK